MNKKKLIEAKKLLQHKLKLIENTLDKMEQDRMEELAGVSEEEDLSDDDLIGKVIFKLEDGRTDSGWGTITRYYVISGYGNSTGPNAFMSKYEIKALKKQDGEYVIDKLGGPKYTSEDYVRTHLVKNRDGSYFQIDNIV